MQDLNQQAVSFMCSQLILDYVHPYTTEYWVFQSPCNTVLDLRVQ